MAPSFDSAESKTGIREEDYNSTLTGASHVFTPKLRLAGIPYSRTTERDNRTMPRYFTLLEAEKLLPAVDRSIREAVRLKTEYQEAETSIQRATQRIVMLGGSTLDRGAMAADRDRKDAAARALTTTIEEIHELGCQVKDLDTGLVDFPTIYHGQEVLLCWKLGEAAIGFWHDMEEGFRGRKPLDDDFLRNHRGDAVN
jgi:hypothetical protein